MLLRLALIRRVIQLIEKEGLLMRARREGEGRFLPASRPPLCASRHPPNRDTRPRPSHNRMTGITQDRLDEASRFPS
jgi:hypothetical protein